METKKIISFESTGALKEALRIEAFRKGTTVSALIRQILATALKDKIIEAEKK